MRRVLFECLERCFELEAVFMEFTLFYIALWACVIIWSLKLDHTQCYWVVASLYGSAEHHISLTLNWPQT